MYYIYTYCLLSRRSISTTETSIDFKFKWGLLSGFFLMPRLRLTLEPRCTSGVLPGFVVTVVRRPSQGPWLWLVARLRKRGAEVSHRLR